MRFCPDCQLTMRRDVATGAVVFKCACGHEEKGGPADARLFGETLKAEATEDKYRRLIRGAAHDRVNQQVAQECPRCGLDFLTQLRVGAQEVVVHVCSCGYDSTRRGPSASPPDKRGAPLS